MRSSSALIGAALFVGCGGPALDAELPSYEPANQTKAQVSKSSLTPLIIEWPAADRASLEARKADGLVTVRYLGGRIEMLAACRGSSAYAYRAITPKRERVVIRDRNELAASLPIHSATVQGKLEAEKSLVIDLTIVGMYQAAEPTFNVADLDGDCDSATHVVRALSVGAFELSAAASSSIGAGVEVLGAGVEGSEAKERELLNQDGEKTACEQSAEGDESPPYRCGALLRVELAPVVHPSACGDSEPCRSACPAGRLLENGGCVSAAPDRPKLLDIVGPKSDDD